MSDRHLLAVGAGRDAHAEEDRILQRALELPPEARGKFLREATGNNPALEASVLLLLRGHEETGGEPEVPPSPHIVSEEQPGALINHFRLIRPLGEGGMGTVWEAEQTSPWKRQVALKVIKLGMDTRGVVKRFERERQTLALLNHPNIAQVYEAGATGMGRPYFAMELVDGEPITTYCQRLRLERKARLQLFQEACAAIEHAHLKGVIHRDVKPTNILVSQGRAKVIDFGVAKATQAASGTLHTREAQILGTPAYMSPEQALTVGADVDTRADIYALGVVLYELMTGVLPFDPDRLAHSPVADLQRMLTEEEAVLPSVRLAQLQRERKLADNMPSNSLADLDWVIMKAIRKDREERYQTAAALSDDVGRYLRAEPVSVGPPALAYRARKFFRRHRKSVIGAFVLVMALVAATLMSVRQALRADRAERRATLTLADMYARAGLASAERQEPARAALWFSESAVASRDDPQRRDANLRRAAAWRREFAQPIRALITEPRFIDGFQWNPRHPALIISTRAGDPSFIWDLSADRLWQPRSNAAPQRAVWSRDGQLVAAWEAGQIVIRSYPSGEEIAKLASTKTAPPLLFTDSALAVGGPGALVWDWRSGEVRLLPAGYVPIRFRASRDARLLLLQMADSVGICDLDNPGMFRHTPSPNTLAARAQFLDEGRAYYTGDQAGNTLVRDSQTGAVLETYPGPKIDIPLAASPDGRFIVRVHSPTIDRQTGAESAHFPAHKDISGAADFSHDGRWLATGSYDATVKLWSLPDGKLAGDAGVHQHAIDHVAFSPDATLLATFQYGLVRVWRLPAPLPVRTLSAEASTLAALSPDGTLVAPSGFMHRSGALRRTRVFEVATGQELGPELVSQGIIMDAAFIGDGRLALSVSTTPDRANAPLGSQRGTGHLEIWDFASGRLLGDPVPLPSEPRGLALHPSGKWIGVVCQAGEAVEIELAARRVQTLFTRPLLDNASATLANGLCAYSPDGHLFVAYGSYEYFHLWDCREKRELITPFRRDQNTFDISLFGNTLAGAVVTMDSRIEFLDARAGTNAVPSLPSANWPLRVQFSPDGRRLLAGLRNGVAQIWDWRAGQLACPALAHEGAIVAGLFLPGKPWVATGADEGAIKFWDYRTGLPIGPSLPHPDGIFRLQATPDGRTLVASELLAARIALYDLPSLFPEPPLPPEDAKLLAEIEAAAELHPGGEVSPLSREDWLAKWLEFRRKHPAFPAHSLK